jgi:hypothetical protein
MNRTQVMVVVFLAAALLALGVILVVAPGVIDAKMPRPGDTFAERVLLLGSLTVLISVLTVGVSRRWRWMFWLVTLAFLAGALRVPTSGLQLLGSIPKTDPEWYVGLQGLIGAIQLIIGLLMLRGYRLAGPWGRF